ncbi:ATP-dependent RNA helicase DHX8 [Nadsonia fulvescens var. elongata DSM 6958]|uniref:U1 small nuclear ribonucleoprotein component SNU71 n=1 Tax=Nadsonia fulvescens var. elongata DSM 6958 TaxID=857566 RepID=A0A1E3PNS0_9ASCO|nr:ATP-dependent RNA helicase DHX8 [Nadsonia fulvescens var. elongata DSM 6958]
MSRLWVSDNLIKLLGASDDGLVDFCLATAQTTKSSQALYIQLVEFGLEKSTDTRRFADQLFQGLKGNSITPAPNTESRSHVHNKQDYSFVEIKNSNLERSLLSSQKARGFEKTSCEVGSHAQSRNGSDMELKDDRPPTDHNRSRSKSPNRTKSTKIRPSNESSDSRELGKLRLVSRQQYLSKREGQSIFVLEKEIQAFEDDIDKYGWDGLTRHERNEYKLKKKLLAIAQERKQTEEDGDSGYMLPEDYITDKGKIDKKKKENALYGRYKDYNSKLNTNDQDNWEREQVSRVMGKNEKPHANSTQDIEYDFVFDERQNIQFLADQAESITQEQAEFNQKIAQVEAKIESLDDTRKSLPVFKYRDSFLDAVKEHQVLIVVGETGSGKTTQLPQYLHEAGYTKEGMKIGCTQPRRVAAMSVAARVAEEMGVKLGKEVGYSIRFEDKSGDKTILKYMTDAIMIDEAHERTLHTDILFGLLKDIIRSRPDIRLLIASATVNAQKFSGFFDDAPVFGIPGRRFPVDIHYTAQPEANYLHAAITTVFQIHTTQKKGDILVFLCGQEEIEAMEENLAETCRKLGDKIPQMIICPIYANLPPDLQAKIFEPTPANARKVVLATNIAETSITIDGIAYVIDPGFVKENVFNPRSGMDSLVVTPCSRASAEQRAGRAGRVGPGKCFRLFTKYSFYNEMPKDTTPEILRANLTSVVLLLMTLGINDLLQFEFVDSPPKDFLIKALEQLYALGALNDQGALTKIGRQMAEFPTDPTISKAILASDKFNCLEEVICIVSMLGESGSLFFRPKDKKMMADKARENFTRPGGDHITLLEIWNQWVETNYSSQWAKENFLQLKSLNRARDVREQFIRLCSRVEIDYENRENNPVLIESIQRAITSGFFANSARLSRNGDSYRSAKTNQTIFIHPSSVLYGQKPKWVIYHELVLTSKEFMRNCMPLKPEWLLELAPHFYKRKEIEEMGGTSKKLPKS